MSEIKHIGLKDDEYKDKFEFVVILPDVEVRKCFQVDNSWTDKTKNEKHETSFLQVTVLDEKHDCFAYLHDPDIENAEKYKRGTIGTFEIAVSFDESTTWGNDKTGKLKPKQGKTRMVVKNFIPADE